MADKLDMKSMDITQENIAKIKALFPSAVTEVMGDDGKVKLAIDFECLKQELSDDLVSDKAERYQMTWPDKSKAKVLANSRITATLRPDVEKSVDFDTTENLYIEGDNLDVLKLLQETYLHKIDVIYIDPPYNTGKNYIYKNDFSIDTEDFLRLDSQYDEDGNRLVVNVQTNGRFHTDWLNMMYARLKVARNLLTEDGVLIVAIDENELSTLAIMLKEIFGEASHEITYTSVVHNPRGQQGNNFSYTNEFALFVYPKKSNIIQPKLIDDSEVDWSPLRNWGGESLRTDARNCFYPIIVKDGKIVGFGDVSDNEYHPEAQSVLIGDEYYIYPIDRNGIERKWRYARQTVESIITMIRAKKTSNGYDIEIGKNFATQKTIWDDSRYDSSVYGSQLVQKLMNLQDGFSFPKSLWLVYDSLYSACCHKKDAIVLDFFSGSATTAHALMELNVSDGGNRKFILVQVPEKCSEKEEAIKKGYKTICDIGEERIRRAGKKIKEEKGLLAQDIDVGFRVLKLDSSNMQEVYYNPSAMTQDILAMTVDNVKPDRTPLDLLFQVMLDLGIELSAKIEEHIVNGKKYYTVNGNDIIACFDDDIDNDVITAIAKQNPLYAVFKDKSFATDSVGINNEQLFKTYSPSTVVKVI